MILLLQTILFVILLSVLFCCIAIFIALPRGWKNEFYMKQQTITWGILSLFCLGILLYGVIK